LIRRKSSTTYPKSTMRRQKTLRGSKRPGRAIRRQSEVEKRRRELIMPDLPVGGLPTLDTTPMMPPRKASIYTFRRTMTLGTIAASISGDTINAWPITLGALPGATEFTSLFDQYRILECTYSFIPYFTEATSSSSGTVPGIIGSAVDYDDANFVLGLSDLQQYESYQRVNCVVPFKRVVRPRSAVAMYSGAFTSFGNVYGQWIDSASPTVQHYGLKTVIHGTTFAASTNLYELEATVVLQCRSLH